MTSLEYLVYDNIPIIAKYLDNITDEKIYNLQIKQLNKQKEIYKIINKKECYNEFYEKM